jgi:hypothetical protein
MRTDRLTWRVLAGYAVITLALCVLLRPAERVGPFPLRPGSVQLGRGSRDRAAEFRFYPVDRRSLILSVAGR